MEVYCEQIEVSSDDEDDVIITKVVQSKEANPMVKEKLNTSDIHSNVEKGTRSVPDKSVEGMNSSSDNSVTTKTGFDVASVVRIDKPSSNTDLCLNSDVFDGLAVVSVNSITLHDNAVAVSASEGKVQQLEPYTSKCHNVSSTSTVVDSTVPSEDIYSEQSHTPPAPKVVGGRVTTIGTRNNEVPECGGDLTFDGNSPLLETSVTGACADKESTISYTRGHSEMNEINGGGESCAIDFNLVHVEMCNSTSSNVDNSSAEQTGDGKTMLQGASVCGNAKLAVSNLGRSVMDTRETFVKNCCEDSATDSLGSFEGDRPYRLGSTGASNQVTLILECTGDPPLESESIEEAEVKVRSDENSELSKGRNKMNHESIIIRDSDGNTVCEVVSSSQDVCKSVMTDGGGDDVLLVKSEPESHDMSCNDAANSSMSCLFADSISTFEEMNKPMTEQPACIDDKLRMKPVVLMKSSAVGNKMRTLPGKESKLQESNGMKTAEPIQGGKEFSLNKRRGRPSNGNTKWNLSAVKKSGPVRDNKNIWHCPFCPYTHLANEVVRKHMVVHKVNKSERCSYSCSDEASVTLAKCFHQKALTKSSNRGTSSIEANVNTQNVGNANQTSSSDANLSLHKNDKTLTEAARSVSGKPVSTKKKSQKGTLRQHVKLREDKLQQQKACLKKRGKSSAKYACSSLGCSFVTSHPGALGGHQKACVKKHMKGNLDMFHEEKKALEQTKEQKKKCPSVKMSLAKRCSKNGVTLNKYTLDTSVSTPRVLRSISKSQTSDISEKCVKLDSSERLRSMKGSSRRKSLRNSAPNHVVVKQSSEKVGHSKRLAREKHASMKITMKDSRSVQLMKRSQGKRKIGSGKLLKKPNASQDLSQKGQRTRKMTSPISAMRGKRGRPSSLVKGAHTSSEKVPRFIEELQFASEERGADMLLKNVGTPVSTPTHQLSSGMIRDISEQVMRLMSSKVEIASVEQCSIVQQKGSMGKKKMCKESCEDSPAGLQIACCESLASEEPVTYGEETKGPRATIEIDRAVDLDRSVLYSSYQFVEMDSVQTSVQSSPARSSVQFSPRHIAYPYQDQSFLGPHMSSPPLSHQQPLLKSPHHFPLGHDVSSHGFHPMYAGDSYPFQSQVPSPYMYPFGLPSHLDHVPRQLNFAHTATLHALPACSDPSGSPWKCRFCDLLFPTPADVVRHENAHLGELQ